MLLSVVDLLLPQDVQCREKWAEEASVMFERATSGPLKSNLLIHFAFADFEEVVCAHVSMCVGGRACVVCVHECASMSVLKCGCVYVLMCLSLDACVCACACVCTNLSSTSFVVNICG